ncbi:MAG: neutral/alkaline non-lysosomal ceramidase N-terminal domain-containing protein [Bryobacter sp.]|nr:neutral/alkaline non-lysosomal ceramidase N-terminal domain-containing protein [Bryobacter sp.]
MKISLAFFSVMCAVAATTDYRAGVARVKITPDGPIWMSGYASRNHPSTGVKEDLWAKALALEDRKGNRVVVVTTDLLGIPRGLADQVAAQVQKRHGLKRAQLLLNSSHTHAGPVVRPNLELMYDLKGDNWTAVQAYAQKLALQLVEVTGAALGAMEPASLTVATGRAGFAVNRREATPKGVKIGVNPQGAVDHDVPVLRVRKASGPLLAVLFGYACHNTTMGGDNYELHGDYAGFAQLQVEAAHPGAQAMFLMLCGGNINPNPRGKREHVEQYGRELAAAVAQAAQEKPVKGTLASSFRMVDLPFAPHSRADFEAQKDSANVYLARRAKAMLAAYDDRKEPRTLALPVQAIRFGNELAMVAFGGEVVVDYALQLKKQYPKTTLVVAAYSNDVPCYITTTAQNKEGGYEPVDSMIYYGQPGPLGDDAEARLLNAAQATLKQVGVKP